MLSPERVEQIFALRADGMSVRTIAKRFGHSPQTVRDYLHQRRTPGIRATSQPDLFTDAFADYCRRRLLDDPHLRRSTLFSELIELGFQGSRPTFYRGLARHQLPPPDSQRGEPSQGTSGTPRVPAHRLQDPPALPRSSAPITGETLISYLTRLAHANHLTLTEVLTALPPWFTTKINNHDDRAQHHMLTPASAEALHALAHLTSRAPTGLARALPAFGTADTPGPVRATTACHRCTARRGITQPVPVHLPAHHRVCTRHGIWLSDTDQPHLDLAACPEIITAQHQANRLLRRCTPQQLMSAHLAAAKTIPPWPALPTAIPFHWRHRLLTLQTVNQHLGTATDHDAYTNAAKYPDAIALAAATLSSDHPPRIQQDPLADSPRPPSLQWP